MEKSFIFLSFIFYGQLVTWQKRLTVKLPKTIWNILLMFPRSMPSLPAGYYLYTPYAKLYFYSLCSLYPWLAFYSPCLSPPDTLCIYSSTCLFLPANQYENSLRPGALFCSLLCPQALAQCLAHSRCSVNICWTDDCLSHTFGWCVQSILKTQA